MFWYPTNDHILYTANDLNTNSPVSCGVKDVLIMNEVTAIQHHEVESVGKPYGTFEIDLYFTLPRDTDAKRQTRDLKLCLDCENSLLWHKLETIEKALKALGSSI